MARGNNRNKALKKARAGKARATPIRTLHSDLEKLAIATGIQPMPSIMDVPKMVVTPRRTFTVKQNAFYQNLTTTATGTFGAVVLTLNSFSNSTAFASLFDSWKILQATVRFVPQVRPGTGVAMGPLLTAIDYDDAVVPTTSAQLREYESMYEVPWGNYVERTWVPSVANAVYSGAFTSFAQYRGWIDVGSPGVQWYGLKWATDSAVAVTNAYVIELEAVLQFQCVR